MADEPRKMDEGTKKLYDEIVELCDKSDYGLDDYGIIDALAHAIVKFAR